MGCNLPINSPKKFPHHLVTTALAKIQLQLLQPKIVCESTAGGGKELQVFGAS